MKYLLPLWLLLLPVYAVAESAISCHCFQDRSFNHRDSAAADPYFLATAQNSFISLLYGVDKRELVKAKMAGTSGSHLWILHDIADRSRQPADRVAALYAADRRWPEVFRTLGLSPSQVGEEYWQLGSNPEQLADHILDLQLQRQFAVSGEQLRRMRSLGMNGQEMLLAILLDGEPEELFNQVTAGMQTWGRLLYDQGLPDGKAINRKLSSRMSTPRN